MDFLIRPAERTDAEAIARVHAASWRTTYQGLVEDTVLDSFDRDLDQRASLREQRLQRTGLMCWVLTTPGGRVVGFADGGPIRAAISDFSFELYALYLLRGWQGVGAGRALIRHLADNVKQVGGENLLVWVLKDNPARRFYEHLGAHWIARDTIQIGSRHLEEWAYGWTDLSPLFA